MTIWTATQGQGDDLVVIHGWGMNANVWQPILTELSAFCRVTLVDLPGFGDSVETTLSTDLDQICRDLAPVLPDSYHVLGWSLGGLVATQLALTHASKVQSLTTVASSPCFVSTEQWPGIEPRLLAQFHQLLKHDFNKTIERFMAVQAMGSPHAKDVIKQVREHVFKKPTANLESLKAGLQLLEQVDLRAHLGDLQMPFLRCYGRLDSLVPAAAIPLINDLAPNSEHHVFQQCAHAPFISAATEFVDVVRGFLTR